MPEDSVADLDEASAGAYHMTSDLVRTRFEARSACCSGALRHRSGHLLPCLIFGGGRSHTGLAEAIGLAAAVGRGPRVMGAAGEPGAAGDRYGRRLARPPVQRQPVTVILAMSAALAAFGLINAAAVAGGAWFWPVRWPVLRRTYAVARD
jgi:hypothetical protein